MLLMFQIEVWAKLWQLWVYLFVGWRPQSYYPRASDPSVVGAA